MDFYEGDWVICTADLELVEQYDEGEILELGDEKVLVDFIDSGEVWIDPHYLEVA